MMKRRIENLETQIDLLACDTNAKFDQLAMQNTQIINLLNQNGMNYVPQMPTPVPILPPMQSSHHTQQEMSNLQKKNSAYINSALYSIPMSSMPRRSM